MALEKKTTHSRPFLFPRNRFARQNFIKRERSTPKAGIYFRTALPYNNFNIFFRLMKTWLLLSKWEHVDMGHISLSMVKRRIPHVFNVQTLQC